ncbi:hypothetical protein [Pseudooceanicola sp. LIPI14-2-Ac024]|uniref:hypothetical protein n=1 Tax=Pseudooceanicola sp. LIPI14-2-Ac024 TaxID=3344875 RepID=UPI0035CE9CAC
MTELEQQTRDEIYDVVDRVTDRMEQVFAEELAKSSLKVKELPGLGILHELLADALGEELVLKEEPDAR